jgi:ABC-2 type transport system ATP-binding protein
MIEIRRVSKLFGYVHAVREVSLEVRKGQCVGLLGPNGAGKTTTIRMITGFIPPTTGEIFVASHNTVTASIAARRQIGYLPESTPLHTEMRVQDFLSYRGGLYGLDRYERRRSIASAVDVCRLTGVETRRIGELSKGYRQRVGLAAALVHNPPVLILDEPTSGLDPTQIRDTRSLIKDLAQKRTVVVSSHILPEIEKTCDRVVIMARGRVLADGSPAELTATGGPPVHIAEVRAERAGDAISVISGLAGVARVVGVDGADSTSDAHGYVRLHVTVQGGDADLRSAIASALAAIGAVPRELTRASRTLEQVFIELIEAERGAARVQSGERSTGPTEAAA